METNKLLVTEIQRFCMHDGPGLRTVVFLKGCPLRCRWCHNPETQLKRPQIMLSPNKCIGCRKCENVCSSHAQLFFPERKNERSICKACGECCAVCPTDALSISGREMTVDEVITEVKKDIPFFGEKGGITVSGGEPTVQSDALCKLLKEAKYEGIGTCIETSGAFPKKYLNELLPITDLFLFDVKDTDSERFFSYTGGNLKDVTDNLLALDKAGGKSVMRCILIPSVNINETHARKLAELFGMLQNCEYIELLPYHPYGSSKAEQLGITQYDIFEKPEKDEVYAFAELLQQDRVPVKCYGSKKKSDNQLYKP